MDWPWCKEALDLNRKWDCCRVRKPQKETEEETTTRTQRRRRKKKNKTQSPAVAWDAAATAGRGEAAENPRRLKTLFTTCSSSIFYAIVLQLTSRLHLLSCFCGCFHYCKSQPSLCFLLPTSLSFSFLFLWLLSESQNSKPPNLPIQKVSPSVSNL